MSSKASLLKQIIQQLQKFDKETGIIKTKAATNKKDDGIFVEDTVFVASDNLEILPVIGFYSVPSPERACLRIFIYGRTRKQFNQNLQLHIW